MKRLLCLLYCCEAADEGEHHACKPDLTSSLSIGSEDKTKRSTVGLITNEARNKNLGGGYAALLSTYVLLVLTFA